MHLFVLLADVDERGWRYGVAVCPSWKMDVAFDVYI